MQDAAFALPNALITEKVVTSIDDLPLKDKDLKGELYEYMISKIQAAGRIGQFRTPRHIIQMMVRMMKPTLTDVIVDKIIAYLIQSQTRVQTSKVLATRAFEVFYCLADAPFARQGSVAHNFVQRSVRINGCIANLLKLGRYAPVEYE